MKTQTVLVADFLKQLDGFADRIPLDFLMERLWSCEVGVDDLRRFVRFGKATYQRNLLHAGPAYYALVLCWRSGQRSPIHDHRGSACGVRVIRGVATETLFQQNSEGLVYPTSSRELSDGTVCGAEDADIHQMSNLQPAGCDLVTLHIYSPPLLQMGQYSLTQSHVTEFTDPVFEFAEGDGI